MNYINQWYKVSSQCKPLSKGFLHNYFLGLLYCTSTTQNLEGNLQRWPGLLLVNILGGGKKETKVYQINCNLTYNPLDAKDIGTSQ